MINEDNLIKWDLVCPEGWSTPCGEIFYNDPFSYEKFANDLAKCKGLSQYPGIRCNKLSFICDSKSIGLLTIRDLKNKLGDRFPNCFYFNNDMLYWKDINQNKLLIKLGKWYKNFKL